MSLITAKLIQPFLFGPGYWMRLRFVWFPFHG